MGMAVRKMEETDLLAVQAMLARARVETKIEQKACDQFVVIENEEGTLVGTVGLEKTGTYGLLRTLVLDAEKTYPAMMIEFLQVCIAYAQAEGVETLFAVSAGEMALLSALGFTKVTREMLPTEIAQLDHYQQVTQTEDATTWCYSCSPE
ncbi:hypothetical protein [Shouchella lonarensis]|uniref:N-acetylglutamate synthase, GNAT family n=1 Tax=Shouchella lonarensis TaxID=1464122 RepID=A0A1G6GWG8_9BACI|nr:hypothetical protein [Shouchella lonarensis]SDB86392.1 N-acetylglutamate synthase, GNAT family [Shouchella lonarensis]